MREALKLVEWNRGAQEADERIAALAEHICLENVCGESVERLSLMQALEDPNCEDFGDQNLFVTDQRGLKEILKPMIAELEQHCQKLKESSLNLRTTVKKVRYEPDEGGMVAVTVLDAVTGEEREVRGHRIVCTVSVGVLKAGLIEFMPALPEWKKEAIG